MLAVSIDVLQLLSISPIISSVSAVTVLLRLSFDVEKPFVQIIPLWFFGGFCLSIAVKTVFPLICFDESVREGFVWIGNFPVLKLDGRVAPRFIDVLFVIITN